ncbi:MAG: nucleotidyltransferase substrate binding protein [Treponema sp.]|jgi:nucleotidyltransferase substrate binding protein (TIGR01987 family)|nr:nucleotidyltransferase substrate binding protein [Treponema sp.]
MNEDVRWIQRFSSYKNALAALERGVAIAAERPLTELEEQGLIQGFEFTHELSWNLLKDYLEYKGFKDIHGSRDTTRLAFKEGYLENGEIWMDMIRSRNISSHTYNVDTARSIAGAIVNAYIEEFRKLCSLMKGYEEDLRKDVRTS